MYGEPYFEVYDGDNVYRFDMNDTEGLMNFCNDTIERLDPQEIIEIGVE